MRRYPVNRDTFSPCGTCEAKEALEDSGSGVRTDFGIALKELKRRGDGFDDSGQQIPVSHEEVTQVAGACDLVDESMDWSPQLAACYEAQQNGTCTMGAPTEVNITSAVL